MYKKEQKSMVVFLYHQSRSSCLLSSRLTSRRCNIFIGLSSFGIVRIVKLCYVTYIEKHLVKCMIQDTKKSLLPFNLEFFFLRVNVLRHPRRKVTLRQYPMPLQWVGLCMRCYVLDSIFSLL